MRADDPTPLATMLARRAARLMLTGRALERVTGAGGQTCFVGAVPVTVATFAYLLNRGYVTARDTVSRGEVRDFHLTEAGRAFATAGLHTPHGGMRKGDPDGA